MFDRGVAGSRAARTKIVIAKWMFRFRLPCSCAPGIMCSTSHKKSQKTSQCLCCQDRSSVYGELLHTSQKKPEGIESAFEWAGFLADKCDFRFENALVSLNVDVGAIVCYGQIVFKYEGRDGGTILSLVYPREDPVIEHVEPIFHRESAELGCKPGSQQGS
jgi:hypothetical protein